MTGDSTQQDTGVGSVRTSAANRVAAALAEAAATAGYAPSVHNTQPWRWRVLPEVLELYADRSRQLRATDPEGRLLTISCGAALHHAQLALAAEGWAVQVTVLPDPGRPDLLAEITVSGRTDVTAEAIRLVQAMQVRHTDRRPVADQELPSEALEAVRGAATEAHIDFHVLAADQLGDLAVAAGRATELEAEDPEIQAELAYWTSRRPPAGTGLPEAVLPANPPQTTVPARDFGHPGTLPIGPGHDRSAMYGVLFGDDDGPACWLRAGQALSAAWLSATERGISLVPLSGVVEVGATRQILRRVLSGLGHPYLVVRLGVPDPDHAGPPHTPRLPAAQTVDTSAVQREHR